KAKTRLGGRATSKTCWRSAASSPASSIKAAREHRVPLSDAAMSVLSAMAEIRVDEHVFPGRGGTLSHMALRRVLASLDRAVSVHGFRNTFRDWAAEMTAYPREVCEMALAHAVTSQVEAAYRRGDLFQKRRRLMADWAQYCAAPPAIG